MRNWRRRKDQHTHTSTHTHQHTHLRRTNRTDGRHKSDWGCNDSRLCDRCKRSNSRHVLHGMVIPLDWRHNCAAQALTRTLLTAMSRRLYIYTHTHTIKQSNKQFSNQKGHGICSLQKHTSKHARARTHTHTQAHGRLTHQIEPCGKAQ